MHNSLTLWLVHPDDQMCDWFRRRFDDLPRVRVIRGRFEELEPHDCFVTAGNSFGMMTAGIDAAVVRYFGEELLHAVQHKVMDEYLGEQPVGTAFLVPTGHTSVPFLCHTPTMRVPGNIEGTDQVYTATWAALLVVHAHNVRSDEKIETVAFPAFGTGFGGVPTGEAARQMAAAYRHYLNPPHRLDWDWVADRQRAICYNDGRRVVRG
jgi:O-acetyl-ADP-ribose deacetylase (regulator of RNase III)